MVLHARPLTPDEYTSLRQLAHSRTAPARLVERARIICQAQQGRRVSAIAAALRLNHKTVRRWLQHFNEHGLAGLEDQPRTGRPATYTAAEVGTVIALALTDPQQLGLPFGAWTLDRLAAYLHEHQGIAIKRSRIGELLLAEGLRWRSQETWYGERVDPAFAENRGPSSPSTPPRRRAV